MSSDPAHPGDGRVEMRELHSLAEVPGMLRELRETAASPSYSKIVRRVAAVRARRGVPAAERTPGRVTVYDCFRDDRVRFDIDLVVDIARALGVDDDQAKSLAHRCWALQHAVDASRIVSAHTNLPESGVRFVGRIPELARIVSGGDRGLVVISGMAGCGKSRLAAEAARKLVESGRADHVVIAHLRGFDADRPPAESGAVLEAIVRALDADPLRLPSDPELRRTAFAEILTERRAVVILDDASGASQIEPLAVGDAAAILVTTRVAIGDVLDAVTINLDVLSVEDSVELLAEVAGPAVDLGDGSAALADLAGRLPLALNVLGARIRHRPDWTAADHVSSLVGHDGRLRLDDAVVGVLAQSYGTLTPHARRALRLVASQPCRDIGAGSVAALIARSRSEAEELIGELATANVATRSNDGRVALHSLVKSFASEQSLDEDRPSARADALSSLLDHLVASARAAAGAMQLGMPPRTTTMSAPPRIDSAAAAAWFAAEIENLLTVIDDSCATLRPAIPIELSEALFAFLQRAGRHADAIMLHRRALATARRLGDHVGEAVAELHLGQNLAYVGDAAAGTECLRRADVLLTRHPWTPAEVRVKNALAIHAAQRGDRPSSLALFREALELAERGRLELESRNLLNNIGAILREQGDLEGAALHLTRALRADEAAGHNSGIAGTLLNLSQVELERGESTAARQSAQRALELAESEGLALVAVYAKQRLGDVMSALGDTDQAYALMREAATGAERLGHRQFQTMMLNDLAQALVDADRLDEATSTAAEALELARDIGSSHQLARAHTVCGRIAARRGHLERARADFEAALAAFDETAPEAVEVRTALDAIASDEATS